MIQEGGLAIKQRWPNDSTKIAKESDKGGQKIQQCGQIIQQRWPNDVTKVVL